MNLNRLPCANTHHLNRYMAELDREAAYEDAIDGCAAEIAADLMSAGYCNVQIGRRVTDIGWEDFLLMVDEEDFVQCELESRALDAESMQGALTALKEVPRVPPEQAEAIARQLFFSIGGMGSAFSIGELLARQGASRLMGEP